jgi:AmmeMemoRadiSam system protein B
LIPAIPASFYQQMLIEEVSMQSIRPAAVAGMFYPGNAATLGRDVDAMLAQAEARAPQLAPKVLIAPHAGYIYSGPVAASAYALLRPVADRIHRVILLGPTHRVAVRGLALPGAKAFATPLGEVEVDLEAACLIDALPQVVTSPQVHAQEHSLEVHLPFLQSLLPDFKLLPLAVGMASAEEVAEVLEILWGGEETLIVISSDLSHYLPYDMAKRLDGATAQAIMQNQPVSHEQACGGTPVNGLLLAARHHHLTPYLLDLRNSGDTAGSKDRVVGYGAFAFTETRT